ncbi:MAG: Asp-tRNA(Asn)/Glu-tRNA(Gln) amidotransferase subunit GatC [Syntrophobacterales bacterium]|nr:Asp-tRNA(Asn)/Glu-tRNA(Gln) amidotransferase subunit GatC [Syntrophobacterales bacterium]
MAISPEEVLHVASLARLTLAPEEVGLFTRQLGEILAYVNKLAEVDTAGVTPMTHVLPEPEAFREDRVSDSLPREEALTNAPAREEGAFVVPRVI